MVGWPDSREAATEGEGGGGRGREGEGNWEHGLRIHKKLSMLRGAYSDNRGLHPEEEQDQSERGRKSREREGIRRGRGDGLKRG